MLSERLTTANQVLFLERLVFNKLFVFLLLAVVILVFESTSLDIEAQNLFYNRQTGYWLIGPHLGYYNMLKLIFYSGVKGGIIIFGIGNLIALIRSSLGGKAPREKAKRKIIVLSLILIPATVSGLKHVTNTYCPYHLKIYNGDKPYVKLFQKYPEHFQTNDKGRCFPAGHASGGFALMCLYFVMKRRRLGLLIGLGLGWMMGLYQMFRGAHFLSHTLVTMFLSWLMILWIYDYCAKDFKNEG